MYTTGSAEQRKSLAEERQKNLSKNKIKEEMEGEKEKEKVKRTNSDKSNAAKATEAPGPTITALPSSGSGAKKKIKEKKPTSILAGPTKALKNTLRQSSLVLVSTVHDAARNGDKKEVKRFVKKDGGRNYLDFQVDAFGQTTLHIACEEGHLELASLMLTKYKMNIDARDNSGWTALFCACSTGRLRICELLLNDGADASIKSNDNATALHYLVRNIAEDPVLGVKVLAGLIENGAEINCQNINGETALHIAADRGFAQAVELLLEKNGNPNLLDKYNESPLHHATRRDHKDIVTTLLGAGADRSIRGDNGTPQEIAESKGLHDMAELIKSFTPKAVEKTPSQKEIVTGPPVFQYKIVLVGDSKVSCKTEVLSSYLKNSPKMRKVESAGDNQPLQVEGDIDVDGKMVHITIIDAPSTEQERAAIYPSTDLFLVLFSLVNPDTLRNVLKKWIPEVLYYGEAIPYFLVGTNSHLREDPTTLRSLKLGGSEPVPAQQGNDLAKKWKALKYFECSTSPPHQEKIVSLFKDEVFRLLASPSTKEMKELSRQRKAMDKIKGDVSAAKADGRIELSLRKKAIDNTHIPKTLGRELSDTVRRLILSDNKLIFFPLCLLDLANLEVLELRNNQLSFLPKGLPKLKTLKKLDVENNSLRALPGEMGSMTHLLDLKLKGNQLLDSWLPLEAQCNGTRGILAYLRDLLKGAERCYRMKLMFVGKENAGKTSLSYYLQHGKKLDKPPLSTDGIDIRNWEIPTTALASAVAPELAEKYMQDNWSNKPISFTVWDFAGQEVYYSTHQFYLSRRSLYIVVFALNDTDIMSGNYSRVLYWLQSVNAKAKGAPIVVVGTRQDLCAAGHVKEVFMKMKDTFSPFGVKHYLAVSCLNGRSLPELRNLILEIALKQRTMGEQIPKSYLELEQLVAKKRQEMSDEKKPPTMKYEQMRTMAIESVSRLEDEETLVRALQFLHELGSVVYFSDPRSGLSDIVILDPNWLTEMMATVVSSKTQLDKGIMHHKFLTSHIWKGEQYPTHLHDTLLKLMEKFYIMFRLRRRRPVLRATADVIGPTPNQLSFNKGDKILLLEKIKMGKWWKGMHNGHVGYFSCANIIESNEPPEYTLEDESLVPCLLPEDAPSNVGSFWPAFPETQERQVGRRWSFEFLPLPFFSLLMVRMFHYTESRVHWRYGMVVEKANGSAFLQVNHGQGYLDVNVRGAPSEVLNLISLIEDEVDTLKDWFGVTFNRVTVPCSHCVKSRLNEVHVFNLDDCEVAVSQDLKTLTCEARKVLVPLIDLVPDIAMAQYEKIPYSEVAFDRVLGEGAFADVYKATYKGEELAVKRLKNKNGFREFRTEVKFMSTMDHHNIVHLRGICLNPPCICTEFMDQGDLHSFLTNSKNTLIWSQCVGIARDIAAGMNFLHSQHPPKIHRDLKSPNVLLRKLPTGYVAKVADFGTARALAPTIGGRNVDNPLWLAPEVMRSEEYTEKVDVYSYGIILWEIFTRALPFGRKTRFQVELGVIEGDRPEAPEDWPPYWRALTTECWDGDPARRPSFSRVLERLQKDQAGQVYRARTEHQCDGSLAVKILPNDTLFPLAAMNDPKTASVLCLHKNKEINVPVAFLESQCDVLDFVDYYAATNASGGAVKFPANKDDLDELEKRRRKKQEKARKRHIHEAELQQHSDETDDSSDDEDDEKEGQNDGDLLYTPRHNGVSSPVEAVDEVAYGFHRVLDDVQGRLPHVATCLDNTASLANGREVQISVVMLCMERGSMQHMERNHGDVTTSVMNIVPERGKMHNPATNSSGLLLGRIRALGEEIRQDLAPLKEEDLVIPACSLSSIPLRISGVRDKVSDQLVKVEGEAILFPRYPLIPVPYDLRPEIALICAEISGALGLVSRFVSSNDTVLVLGCGRIGIAALCYVRKLAPSAHILALDAADARIEIATSLKKANVVEKINIKSALEVLAFVKKHTKGGKGADVVLNCVTASDIEASSMIAARPQGTVILCAPASCRLDNITNFPTSDVCVVVSGYWPQVTQTQQLFELLRTEKQLQTVLATLSQYH
eukprot:TRINITY_DN3484_c0_g1_i2.p1 TRINITY_DN3484_c0_g1~~TRINITY_DN3484_c0_g1_i2.p1  ORF type:complete len:2043 (+),score=287.04 TRINITY_DN3484_c0_g1_i2:206-6334(+)